MEKTVDRRTQLIASDHIRRSMLRLAGPSIISMVVMAVYNMADTFFVADISGTDLEVAAVSVYMPVLLITQSISVLFASGGAAYLSRLLGEDKLSRADEAATTTIVIAFLSGVVVACLGTIWVRPIMLAVGATEGTVDMAVQYAVIMLLTAPVQLTNMSFNNLLRAEGNAVRSMVGTVTGALLNIVLDPVLITGMGLGVPGAATATAIAQVVAFIILGSAYWRRKTTASVRLKGFRFQSDIVSYIVKVGFSTFLVQICTALGIAVINVYVRPYGDGALAAVGIVNRLQFLGFAVVFGFAQGFQPVCGYNFGAQRYELLRQTIMFGIIMSMILGAGLVLLFRLAGKDMIGMFVTGDDVLRTGVDLLDWFTAAFPLTAFSLIMMMTYQSLGRAVEAGIIAVCRQGVCMIPTVMIMAETLGFRGIAMSPLIADLISAVVAFVLAWRVFRYIARLRIGHEDTAAA